MVQCRISGFVKISYLRRLTSGESLRDTSRGVWGRMQVDSGAAAGKRGAPIMLKAKG